MFSGRALIGAFLLFPLRRALSPRAGLVVSTLLGGAFGLWFARFQLRQEFPPEADSLVVRTRAGEGAGEGEGEGDRWGLVNARSDVLVLRPRVVASRVVRAGQAGEGEAVPRAEVALPSTESRTGAASPAARARTPCSTDSHTSWLSPSKPCRRQERRWPLQTGLYMGIPGSESASYGH